MSQKSMAISSLIHKLELHTMQAHRSGETKLMTQKVTSGHLAV